jgi:hypothetical protein
MTPEFDTDAWRKLRDDKLYQWIGDPHALEFLITFGDICEVWDDLIDQDKPILPEDIHRAFWSLLIELPLNPFFDKFKANIIPVLITGVNAWMDSNELEKGNDNDKIFAYVLRDWYMELVSFIIYLTRGKDYLRMVSIDIRRFFTDHETFEKYLERFT